MLVLARSDKCLLFRPFPSTHFHLFTMYNICIVVNLTHIKLVTHTVTCRHVFKSKQQVSADYLWFCLEGNSRIGTVQETRGTSCFSTLQLAPYKYSINREHVWCFGWGEWSNSSGGCNNLRWMGCHSGNMQGREGGSDARCCSCC